MPFTFKPIIEKVKNVKETTIEIENEIRHYFPIIRGKKLTSAFKFYNTGKEPLYIKDVTPSCGCIIPTFPKYAISPGDSGEIIFEYDSNKNIGHVELYLDIYANLKGELKKTLIFDLNVVTDASYTRDYEQQYDNELKKNNSLLLKKGIVGFENQQGYVANDNQVKF